MPFSILIPNYNGRALLEEYLPSVLEASNNSGEAYDVIVVDDGSSDGSGDFIRNKYPKVQVIENDKNVGFGASVNLGMHASRNRIVVLLNNDVRLERDFIKPLLKYFDNPKIFSVVARSLIDQDGSLKNESVTKLEINEGKVDLLVPSLNDTNTKYNEPCTVSHACGGFSAFDRGKFIELGGFDDLYAPFYWEDADICYRAWKHGWWVLYEPESIVYHRRHGTIRKEKGNSSVDEIYLRNSLLFIWKNMSDEKIIMKHIIWLNAYLKSAENPFKAAFYEALKRIMIVLKKRKEQQTNNLLSDNDILKLSSNLKFPEEALEISKKLLNTE